MASPQSHDEAKEDKSKPEDVMDSPGTTEDKNESPVGEKDGEKDAESKPQASEEKRTANAATENTSNLQASAPVEDKYGEKNAESKPQTNDSFVDVELEEKATDPSTDAKSTSRTGSNNKMGSGSKGNPCWSIVWLLLLIFIAFYVAGFCAFIYIIISLFTPCIPPLYKVTDFLMKGVNFVNYCSNNMILMKPLF